MSVSGTGVPLLFRGVDRAAFAAALVARLRGAGVRVSAGGASALVQALEALNPATRSQLYWAVRLTLINRADDLAAFDSVFAAVFGDAMPTGGSAPQPQPAPARASAAAGVDGAAAAVTAALPWVTRPITMATTDGTDTDSAAPDALPSRLIARAGEPFDRFNAQDLHRLGGWLEAAVAGWPRRRSSRREPGRHGGRIDLRRTIKASRSTGWEAMILARTRRRRRLRRVVLLCDVSRSMQPYAMVYLHLMRAAALRRTGLRPEIFAFSTSLTRLTAVLSHRSPEIALQRANAGVVDRYGGTRLGSSLSALLRTPHGNALRGAVAIIASDGWDSDPPEVLDRALARLRRRAAQIVWLNPRAGQPGFRPLTGSMAVALPYCDLLLPAHSLAGLRELFTVLGSGRGQPVERYLPTAGARPRQP